jgi:hypothetical protein
MAVTVPPRESVPLPNGATLRALEMKSRHEGSGLQRTSLIGEWRVENVWGKQNTQPSAATSAALRAVGASLRIQADEDQQLLLCNSIQLGFVHLSFIGPGRLEHRRPLLLFHFSQLTLSIAGKTLVTVSLPVPAPKQEPFFAPIATGSLESGRRWLAARGRGGGMALWVEQADSLPQGTQPLE